MVLFSLLTIFSRYSVRWRRANRRDEISPGNWTVDCFDSSRDGCGSHLELTGNGCSHASLDVTPMTMLMLMLLAPCYMLYDICYCCSDDADDDDAASLALSENSKLLRKRLNQNKYPNEQEYRSNKNNNNNNNNNRRACIGRFSF